MKESGINYFVGRAGLDTGDFKVFYTFEDGAGANVSSVAQGQSLYTGTLSAIGQFWSKPGSGFFSGNSLSVTNTSGLAADNFTHLFAFQKVTSAASVLFSSLTDSGYAIGLTDSNRLYFEANGTQRIVAASYTNLASKNLVAVTYSLNSTSFGYYDFNSRSFFFETFNYPFGALRSDTWTLAPAYTGYMDYYAYFTAQYGAGVLEQIASGVYNIPTGSGASVQTICAPAITGVVNVPYVITGITGYLAVNSGNLGLGAFGGAFTTSTILTELTGVINSGFFPSGLTGLVCITNTGAITTLYDTNEGYASGYGMEKVLFLRHIQSGDIAKISTARLFSNSFNQVPDQVISGYDTVQTFTTGQFYAFLNGLYLENADYLLSGRYLTTSGGANTDFVEYDLFTSGRVSTTGKTLTVTYTGQEVYLNGLNLVSGLDFTVAGTTLSLTTGNTGFSGTLSISSIGLAYVTGAAQLFSTQPFARNTSNVYLNGLRQRLGYDYIEGTQLDQLSGNLFNENGNTQIYDNNGRFWE